MLQKWKQILTNWNNCYFSGNIKDEQKITVDSLINIISHLRQNYNLDESKSSLLEANTVTEFILEKYPEFKFGNGTEEPRNEDEIYMVASLLLFFVCVNSKDVDIKNAMCSKLSAEDQETILKFSRGLMECSAISYRDVQVTITEACGQDIAAMEFTVAETPPALRSYHGEVRRLQAALDAERFDRTYLQEELTRTYARVDKLLKEKEQYKLDIVNLKAKISLCGDELETGGAKADEHSTTLARQLHDLEERLGDIQGRLDDAEYQRDTYKAKVDELRHERDKWLALHQEETSRTVQLSEELEHERRQNNSLQELLAELRQHNKRNGLDSSSLECDDPDASIHSLPHNASICSEVCANVVEVQLGEERAKIVLLQQQIRTLQEQITDLIKKTEAEKLALKDEVAERDHNIFNLKHRINEEIEDKNNLKIHYDIEITKLNNEINELELTLKDNNDHSRAAIEKKMQEIQTLQEEKLILLQSLDSEKTKLEKVIKDLKSEIDTEKQSKSNMKDSYENHLMKLNEKVLKRNNELVEFQNNICEKSQMIESLQVQLKKEKEAAIALGDYCTSLNKQKIAMENELKQNMSKINELQMNLQDRNTNIEDLNIEISNLKSSVSDINATCKDLEAIRDNLVSDIKNRDAKIEEYIKEIEIITETYSKEREKIILDLDERNETVNSLQLQLKHEIDFKIELQKEIPQMRAIKATLTEKLEKLDFELRHLKSEIENNERTIDAMDLYITEEKRSNEQANIKIQQMSEEITFKDNDIEKLNNQLGSVNMSLQEESKKRYEVLSELEPLTEQVKSLCNDNIQLEKEVAAKCQEILELRVDAEVLSKQLDEKETMIQSLELKFVEECNKYDQFELKAANDITKLTNKINETNNIAIECANVLTKEILEKETLINKLSVEVENLKQDLAKAHSQIIVVGDKLNQELACKNLLEENCQIQLAKYENMTIQFNTEIETRNTELSVLKSDVRKLTKNLEEKSEEINEFKEQIRLDNDSKIMLAHEIQNERAKLQNKIDELESLNAEIEQELKKKMDATGTVIKAIKQENEQLLYTIEEDNSHHELLIKEKDIIIDKLEQTIKDDTIKFNDLHQHNEKLKKSWEDYKIQTSATLKEREKEIITLSNEIIANNTDNENNIKEKDLFIEDLEHKAKSNADKFKALHNFSEDLLRSWQTYKNDTVTHLNEKDTEIMHLKNKILLLEQQLIETEQKNEELCRKIMDIQSSKEHIEIILSTEKGARDVLESEKEKVLQEKMCLAQQLIEERKSKEIAGKVTDTLRDEKKKLEENLLEQKIANDELGQLLDVFTQTNAELKQTIESVTKNNSILKEEKVLLNNELELSKANHHYLMEENKDLVSDNENMRKQLDEINAVQTSLIGRMEILNSEKNTFLNSLEVHTQKVYMLESEKADLQSQILVSNVNISKLNDACNDLKEELKKQYEDMNCLQITIEKKFENIVQETKSDNVVLKQNEMILTENLNRHKQEKDKLSRENETLKSELHSIKNLCDVAETEKSNLEKQIGQLETQYEEKKSSLNQAMNEIKILCNKTTEHLINKEKELVETDTEYKLLKTEHESVQKSNSLISDTVSAGLDKLFSKLKKQNLNNNVLQKLANIDCQDMKLMEKCSMVVNIANALVSEIEILNNLEISLKNENLALLQMQDTLKLKELDLFELKTEVNRLQQIVSENKIESSKQKETYSTAMDAKIKGIQSLQQENQALHNDLNDVRVQLEVKVHSLKEKLVDNENLTDKLKKTYECQIDNLNVMITKLSNYLKDKTNEIEALRKDKEQLNETLKYNREVIKSLEDEVKTEKQNVDKIISDFDAERQVLKNMVTVTESVMDDQKTSLNNTISEYMKAKEALQDEVCRLTKALDVTEKKYQDNEIASSSILSLLRRERVVKDLVEKESETLRQYFDEIVNELKTERNANKSAVTTLVSQNKELSVELEKYKNDLDFQQKSYNALQTIKSDDLTKVMLEANEVKKTLEDQNKNLIDKQTALNHLIKEKEQIELNTSERLKFVSAELESFKVKLSTNDLQHVEELTKLTTDNHNLIKIVDEYKTGIAKLEQQIKQVQEENRKTLTDIEDEKISLINKCSTLQNYQEQAQHLLEERQNEMLCLQKEMETLQVKLEIVEQDCKAKDGIISKMSKEKDAVISTINKELVDEKVAREKCEKEIENQKTLVHELKNNMEIRALKKENEQLIRAVGQQETFAAMCQEKVTVERYQHEHRDHHQVDNTSSDNTQSSMESLKTITDLEKIIHDKNRTITTLQQDVTYLKSLMAESENKLLDMTNELEVSKENCQQLSGQLKKMVFQKNEEIADLKKQLSKMSVTENRATQIIKVSAKYQAIILRRIAEIKSNTILKELTNFGNTNNGDKDLRLGLNTGTVTMEDLENFLETTDRHLKRCSEKQIALQKERDRLIEVNRIHESEIISLRKFLTELSVSFQTFSSVKDMYAQKLSRIISVQRTVRREILNLESRINDATMCKLERGYAAVMQDLSECAMNLERWVERCISRTVSVEKIKQAFTSDSERSSLSSPSFQNTGLEIQLDELEKSFQKLLEEVARALKGDGAKDAQSTTVMEVRAEYEDKLNRMKAKMKELFNEQMAVLREKQKADIALLERELLKTRESKEESKLEYEKYIRQLTKELWSVGEKYLVKNDEAEWLRKKQRSGSLMSLQHVHSSGLIQPPEPQSRPSDASSLRSLPVTNNTKQREGRQLHMSDEEGEVFDNRWLKELSATPRRERDLPPGQRLSELKWRNSLCPPHLKSSYPAETQFAPVLDEEDLKAGVAVPAKSQRKEVGITAYKKPGPPTPSKQAGRLSATGSELRESLRVDSEPLADRKASTPSRLRTFLRLNKNDTGEGTPRTRRLSNIFRKNR